MDAKAKNRQSEIQEKHYRTDRQYFFGWVFVESYLSDAFSAAWTEYSLAGALIATNFGAGLWSGQSWGILPAMYDDDGKGGQDIVGKWEKEDGIFRLISESSENQKIPMKRRNFGSS